MASPKPPPSGPTGLRPRVSNESWDARRMLALAEAGAYPQVERAGSYRDEEIAYWRRRVQQDAAALTLEETTDGRVVIE